MKVLRVLGYAWSAPYAVVGLVGAWVLLTLRLVQSARWNAGALELVCRGRFAAWMGGRGWGAFTLGWTIFFWEAPGPKLLRHEHRHVDQALVLGPLYPLVYLALLAAKGYDAHPLEQDARRAAAEA